MDKQTQIVRLYKKFRKLGFKRCVSQVASQLGVSRPTVYKALEEKLDARSKEIWGFLDR